MNKFWTVLGHTYFSKLKSKSFIITTAIVLVIMVGIANIDHIIGLFASEDTEEIAVIDHTGELIMPLEAAIEKTDDDITLTSFDGTEDAGKQAVKEEEYAALLVLNNDETHVIQATFYENKAASSLQMAIENQLQQLKVALATEQAGIDASTFALIYENVPFETVALDESAKTEEELSGTRGIVYVMLFLLYFTVMLYGQMIATEVATEKSSRVMEILISSASPLTHMFAKIIGVGLLGLTQIVVIILAGYLLIANKVKEMSGGFFEVFGFGEAGTAIYFYAIIFFLLGYFLYATISAMLGSLVSRVEDVNQLIMPVIFLIMIAFFIAIFGLGMPDSTFITVTSFIPFFSPMIMFLRVGMIDVPAWEIALSIGILIASIYVLALAGARIYRGGVLMYGGSRSFKDIKNAILLTKKE